MEAATKAAEDGSGKLNGGDRGIPMMRRRKSSVTVLNMEQMVRQAFFSLYAMMPPPPLSA
jgi:hypothetical protein